MKGKFWISKSGFEMKLYIYLMKFETWKEVMILVLSEFEITYSSLKKIIKLYVHSKSKPNKLKID